MSGEMDGWIVGFINRQRYGCVPMYVHGWMNRLADEWVRLLEIQLGGYMNL
jgi:hypothetical protein